MIADLRKKSVEISFAKNETLLTHRIPTYLSIPAEQTVIQGNIELLFLKILNTYNLFRCYGIVESNILQQILKFLDFMEMPDNLLHILEHGINDRMRISSRMSLHCLSH